MTLAAIDLDALLARLASRLDEGVDEIGYAGLVSGEIAHLVNGASARWEVGDTAPEVAAHSAVAHRPRRGAMILGNELVIGPRSVHSPVLRRPVEGTDPTRGPLFVDARSLGKALRNSRILDGVEPRGLRSLLGQRTQSGREGDGGPA